MTSRFLLCCVLCASASAAGAEANLANFKPASGADGLLSTEGARPWESASPLDLRLLVDYGHNPFARRAGMLIEERTGAWLSAELHLLEPLSVAIQIPFTVSQRGYFGVQPGAGQMTTSSGMGDLRITPRFGILRQEDAGIDVAVQASLELATGNKDLFTSWGEPSGEGLLAFGRRFYVGSGSQAVLLLGNVFGFAAPNRTIDGNPVGAGFGGRAGAAYETGQRNLVPSRVFAEVEAKTMPRRALDDGTTPAEWRGGASWCVMPGFSFDLAAGTGIGNSVSSPDYRVVTGLGFGSNTCGVAHERMLAEEKAAAARAYADQVAAEHAARMAAMKAAADREAARLAAERAEWEKAEAARLAAEAAAAAAARDTDGDGVPDLQDNCRTEAGPAANQGCPEEQKQVVVITRTALQILDRVQFATGKAAISRRSHRLLDQVASVLQGHPEIARIEVQGHTDDTGGMMTNMVLSQARAESVVGYLVRRGVDPDRLQAKGYGPTQPVAPNETRKGREQNRRVEFKVLEAEQAY